MSDQYRENVDNSVQKENIPEESILKDEVKEVVDLPEPIPEQSLEEAPTQETEDIVPTPPEKEIRYTTRPNNLEQLQVGEILEKISDEATGEVSRVELTEQEKYNKEKIKELQESENLQLSEMPEISDITSRMSMEMDMTQKKQVEILLNIAQEQGLGKMVRVLKGVKDPEVVDLVHDLLSMSDIYKRFKE
jgi:hypothetical protein